MEEQCGGKVEQCWWDNHSGTVKQRWWNSVVEQWNCDSGTVIVERVVEKWNSVG